MEIISDSIVIAIGTVGYPTFDKCLEHAKIAKEHCNNVKSIQIIRDQYPTSAWLNEMMQRADGYDWCLQVDEDMYINKDAPDILLNFAKLKEKSGVKINNASSMLYDLYLQGNIGSLKLWNTDVFNHGTFKNVLGSDRKFAEDAQKSGYCNVAIKDVLGLHDSAPSIEIAYFKYKEYMSKIKKFQGIKSAKNSLNFFNKIYINNSTSITYAAYLGAKQSFESSDEVCTKNYLENVNSKDIEVLTQKLIKRFGVNYEKK